MGRACHIYVTYMGHTYMYMYYVCVIWVIYWSYIGHIWVIYGVSEW